MSTATPKQPACSTASDATVQRAQPAAPAASRTASHLSVVPPLLASDAPCAPPLPVLEAAGATFDRIAAELCAIAFSRIDNYLSVGEGGAIQAKTFEQIKRQPGGATSLAAIRKIKEHSRITRSKDGETIYTESRIEYELYDKQAALWRLIELRGDKPADTVEHSGVIIMKPDQMAKPKDAGKKAHE
jgi:hypothetical protein